MNVGKIYDEARDAAYRKHLKEHGSGGIWPSSHAAALAAVVAAVRKDCERIATDQIQGPPCDEWDRAVTTVADAIGASC